MYFEVPNALFTIEAMGIWDLIYEHVSYFTEASLQTVFRQAGFSATEVGACYGNQFLSIEAHRAGCGPVAGGDRVPWDTQLTESVRGFRSRMGHKLDQWHARLDGYRRRGERAVVWGAGSKGISFVNFLGAGDEVAALIDLNPHKTGKFVPGTGHRVSSPSDLQQLKPDHIVVMNEIYASEIERMVSAQGLAPSIEIA